MMDSKQKNDSTRSDSTIIKRKRGPLSKAEQKRLKIDVEILGAFTQVYCKKIHHSEDGNLCEECNRFLSYAVSRREKCPLDPKPKCKECPVHCYSPKMREKAREIMRVGGIYFIKHGRLDWAIKYFLFSKSSA